MARAIWSPKAELEFEEIVVHIRIRDGRPETARRIAEQLRDEVDARAAGIYPNLVHPDAPAGWYYFSFKRWLIFYRPHTEGIEVMRVIDGSRDLPSRFEDK